jgi:hypothetical protein
MNARYYIATGAQENFYTLRYRYEEPTYTRDALGNAEPTGTREYDYHVRNLSTDRTAAIAKAKEQTGTDLSADFEVLPMGQKRPVDWSVFQGGRHQGESIHEVAATDPAYLIWACENLAGSPTYAKTVELAAKLSAIQAELTSRANERAMIATAEEMARQARIAALGHYGALIADGRNGFCDSIAADLQRGTQLRGRGLDIAIDILAKIISGKRSGSKAWQAEYELLWKRFDAAYGTAAE